MTATEFEAYKMTVPGATPFAGDATVATGGIIIPGATTGNFSMPDGFDATFDAAPTETGSNMVQRGQINYLGRMASYAPFTGQVGGGHYGFDPAVCEAIGGYPSGAILTLVQSGCYLKIISLKDDNCVDFTGTTDTTVYTDVVNGSVDGVNWQYLSLDPQTLIDQSIIVTVPDMNVPRQNTGILGCFKANYDGAIIVNGGVEMEDLTPMADDETTSGSGGSIIKYDTSMMYFNIVVSQGYTNLSDLDGWVPVNMSSQTSNGTDIYAAGTIAQSQLMMVEEGKWYGIGFGAIMCKLSNTTLTVKLVKG